MNRAFHDFWEPLLEEIDDGGFFSRPAQLAEQDQDPRPDRWASRPTSRRTSARTPPCRRTRTAAEVAARAITNPSEPARPAAPLPAEQEGFVDAEIVRALFPFLTSLLVVLVLVIALGSAVVLR